MVILAVLVDSIKSTHSMKTPSSPLSLSQQRGFSAVFILFFLIILGLLTILTIQSAGAFIDQYNIRRAAEKSVREAQNARQARDIFHKSLIVENVPSLTDENLYITQVDNKIQVQWDYEHKIHLVGPAYLVYHFKGSAQ